jgi:uncharacterized membrane protein
MRKWFPALLILGALTFSAAVYHRLPESVTTHWGPSGEPDGFSSRPVAAVMMPLIMAAVFALLRWIPPLDPRSANISKFRDSYDHVIGVIVAFLGVMHVATLGNALGWPTNMTTIVFVSLGLLFVVLGNVLPRARSNFIFGIRTPWTLSSDTVWTSAHRVGGYAMVAGGLITIAAAFLEPRVGFAIMLPSLLISAFIPIIYSYVLWSRERRNRPDV